MIILALVPLFLFGIFTAALFAVPGAFVSMLLLGALHSHLAYVPALGFVPTYFAFLLARLVFGDTTSSKKES